jgi:hypothetical protein
MPTDTSTPLAWGAPNAIARIPWTASKLMRMDLEIQGLQTLGNYTPPAIAVVDHYDPFKNAVVRQFIDVGGRTGPSPISIVSGAPPNSEQPSMGEVKDAGAMMSAQNILKRSARYNREALERCERNR